MDLSERKKKILAAIIESYVSTAEPVGSRTLSKINELGLSPATIRNEMSDLEEMGLLEQPHTSAGRVPSNQGYRLYVNSLMKRYRLSMKEMADMRQAMQVKYNELDRLVTYAAGCVSQMTGYTTVAATPAVNSCVIKKVEIVPVDERSFLLVIVPNGGTAKNCMFKSEKELKADTLSMLRHFLNLTITDKVAGEISMESVLSLETAMGDNRDLIMPILRFALDAINEMSADNIQLQGVQKMLQFPEYQDVQKVKNFLDMVEDKTSLNALMENVQNDTGTAVIIGDENNEGKSDDNSIIVCKYNSDPNSSGFIGVIGPKRMNYARAITSLQYMTNGLSKMLKEQEAGEQDEKEEKDGG